MAKDIKKKNRKSPPIEELKNLVKLKVKLKKLSQEFEDSSVEYLDKYLEGKFTYSNKKEELISVIIKDNVKAMKDHMKDKKKYPAVYASVGYKPVEVSHRVVKNQPKDAVRIDS